MTTEQLAPPIPSEDDIEGVILSCRYGELDEVRSAVARFGPGILATARDENGASVLHMICGNGHIDLLKYVLPLVPLDLLSATNNAQSTPLHWAALNAHLVVVQTLVQYPGGPGVDLIDIKNTAGRTPLGEAEQAEWDEGAKWMVEVMKLEVGGEEESIEKPTEIEIEVEGIEGDVAKMKVGGTGGDQKV